MRIIAITGATGGVAQAIVSQLPSDDTVIAIGRSKERLDAVYANRSNTMLLACDITDDRAVAEVIETIYRRFGKIDVFINNAGYGDFSSFSSYDTPAIREMFEVNTFATMAFSRLVGTRMQAAGQGHIIMIASMAGLIASAKSSVYSASKFAVIGFSDALRLELAASGVYVTTVNPGPIATDFFDRADPTGDYLEKVKAFTLSPDEVAKRVIAIFGKNKRQLNMPWVLALTHKCYTIFPRLSDFLSRHVFNYK